VIPYPLRFANLQTPAAGLAAPASVMMGASSNAAPTETFQWAQGGQPNSSDKAANARSLPPPPYDSPPSYESMSQSADAFQPSRISETPAQQQLMYSVVKHTLKGHTAKKQLEELRLKGVLADCSADDGHSTLYQMYQIATTPRQTGYNQAKILSQTVDTLSQPYAITQHFAPLSKKAAQKILLYNAHPELDPQNTLFSQAVSFPPLNLADLKVENSATCVAASVMFCMAQKKPAELTRQINEMTSPINAFYKRTTLAAISPDNPAKAIDILQRTGIPYQILDPATGAILIKVPLPTTAVIRAIDAQKVSSGHKTCNTVEILTQQAFMRMVTRYNPANDTDGEGAKGIDADKKSEMESIEGANGSVQSVTYQVVGSKPNANPAHASDSYLYGYDRTFQQIENDLTTALQQGRSVIVGLTDTDASGAIIGGHEITLTEAHQDPKTGELKFTVADSDDDIPHSVQRSAKDIIPHIHHLGLSTDQAKQVNLEIAQLQGKTLTPDEVERSQGYSLVTTIGSPALDSQNNSSKQPFFAGGNPFKRVASS
jgi:hypothetical protein